MKDEPDENVGFGHRVLSIGHPMGLVRVGSIPAYVAGGGAMIHRMSDLIGKPIVAADGGEKLGTVSDLLIDESTNSFVGLVVRHGGIIKREDVLPASSVQTLGRDAIVSRSSADLIDGREWKARQS